MKVHISTKLEKSEQYSLPVNTAKYTKLKTTEVFIFGRLSLCESYKKDTEYRSFQMTDRSQCFHSDIIIGSK